MYRFLWIILIITSALNNCSVGQNQTAVIQGTWMSENYFRFLLDLNSTEEDFNNVAPRLYYIDNKGIIRAENRFEGMAKGQLQPKKIENNKPLIINYGNSKLKYVNDSTLNLVYPDKTVTLIKISNDYGCYSCGIQYFFMKYFFENHSNWKFITGDGVTRDTQSVIIRYGTILLRKTSDTIKRFEFNDISKIELNNKNFYSIVFYEAKDDLIINAEQLAIIKETGHLTLKNSNGAEYKLIKE